MSSQSEISSAFAACLQKIEAGSSVEQVLVNYPHLANDLRDLLLIAINARQSAAGVRVPASAQIDSRRRLLLQAQELKKRRASTGFWAFLSFFRQNTSSLVFATAALTLLFIALGSTRALPGDRLYPVKIAAEQAESSIVSGSSAQMSLEDGFDSRRAAEVTQMIQDRRTGTVRFGGYLGKNKVNNWQAAGISLKIYTDFEQRAQNLLDVYVEISGDLDVNGLVEVTMIQPRLIPITGALQSVEGDVWKINDLTVQTNNSSVINGTPRPGKAIDIQAARLIGTQQLLVISASVSDAGNMKTSEPKEVTLIPSQTPTPTLTQTPTFLPTPIITQTPEPSIDPEPSDDQKDKSDDEKDKPDDVETEDPPKVED